MITAEGCRQPPAGAGHLPAPCAGRLPGKRRDNMNALSMTALGTGFTFLMTAAGASVVFFFRKEVSHAFQRVFLGFAAGVMVAASVWSLLIPAIEMAEEAGGLPGWVPAAGGFLPVSRRA